MAEKPITQISFASDFPFDMKTFKAGHHDIQVFDRESNNPQRRYSLKNSSDKYYIISEDEKFIFEHMDGTRSVDELAAIFMEEHGRIALNLIRGLIYRLWQEGFICDEKKQLTPKVHSDEQEQQSFSLANPGVSAIANALNFIPAKLFFNTLTVILFLASGGFGTYLVNDRFNSLSQLYPLFS